MDDLNGGRLSEDIAESAVIGSMFGWETPGAKKAVDFITSGGASK